MLLAGDIDTQPCDDTSACQEAYYINGVGYSFSCEHPSSTTGSLYAVGDTGVPVAEARLLQEAVVSERLAGRLVGITPLCNGDGWGVLYRDPYLNGYSPTIR